MPRTWSRRSLLVVVMGPLAAGLLACQRAGESPVPEKPAVARRETAAAEQGEPAKPRPRAQTPPGEATATPTQPTPQPAQPSAAPGPPAAATAVLPAVATRPPGVIAQPRGLTAVNEFADETRVGSLFQDATYQNANLAGLTFRTSWADLEPGDGQFKWQKLDEVFQKAEANGKWVRLILMPGFGTPAWALAGAQSATFPIKYGRGQGTPLPLPLPWDQTYLSRWFSFLRAVAQRYGPRPSFRMIAAAGPTSVSSEMSLPNTEPDVEQWRRLGYTPDKYVGAWRQTFAAYADTFPGQYFSLALYPGLPIPDRKARDETRRQVASIGIENYPSRVALQTSGLNANKGEDGAGAQLVREASAKVLVGFMMSTSASRRTAEMCDSCGTAPDALQAAIKKGLDEGARYLEIYEPDVLDPAMQPVLASAAHSLAGPAGAA